MDEVVRGRAGLERLLQAGPGEEVAAHDVDVGEELRAASERAHGPPLRDEAAQKTTADVSGPSGDELHERGATLAVAQAVGGARGAAMLLSEIRPPEKCAASGASESDPANSVKRWVAPRAELVFDGPRADDEARPLRGLLLPAEHALRAQPRQAVHDVPPRRARARARAPARVRLPDRAHHRRVRISAAARVTARLICPHAAHGARQVAVLAGR